tara:strand:+ start:3155 stop:5545 length:2391 start_codon:yes stop_codon:yes gene_type:complete
MALFDTPRLGSSGTAEAYEIEYSLRLNSGAYFNSSLSGNEKKFTTSFWIKRTRLDSHSMIMSAAGGNHPGGADIHQFGIDSSNRLFAYAFINSNSQRYNVKTNAQLEDCSNWYHIHYNYDSTQSTSSNRIRLYINGQLQTDLAESSYPSQNENNYINNGYPWIIGHESRRFRYPLHAYLADFYFIDDQYLDVTDFGETENGVFIPKEYAGTYSGTSFFFEFKDASNFGTDTSGEGNNWSHSGLTNSNGINGDQFTDVPTNNFCTWQNHFRSHGDNLTLRNGLVRREGGADKCMGTFILKNGKYYFEYYAEDNNGNHIPGVTQVDTDVRSRDNTEAAFYAPNGEYKIEGGSQTGGLPTYGSGDIIGVAIDTTLSTPKVWFAKNNSWILSGDPANGSNGLSLTAGKEYVFNADHGSGSSSTTGTGFFGAHQGGFNYTPPSGFVAACAANLPTPTILDGRKHFHTLFYTGTSSDHAISGLEFSPDWVWIKERSTVGQHSIFDSVRGATKRLGNGASGVGTASETTVSASLKSFDTNGFTMGAEAGNNNGQTHVAWCWNAGDTTVTNTNGTISSQVRADPLCGFSIVTYSGNGTSGATVGHGLGVKPAQIIIRRREGDNWMYYHQELNFGSSPENRYVELNATAGQVNDSRMMNNTAPTSTVFSLRNDNSTNGSSGTYVAYCFAEIDGFSKFGRYTGNGNTNGTYIWTGFRVAYVIVKSFSGASEHWNIPVDTDRNNPVDKTVSANLNNAERNMDGNNPAVHFYSNGFKITNSDNNYSNNGAHFIYYAIARNPFKHTNAR